MIDFDGLTADRLEIIGAASGMTTVDVPSAGGIAINPDGVLVVDTTTTAAGAFVAWHDRCRPDRSQPGPGRQDFFLTAIPDLAAIEPVVIGDLAQSLWYQSADIYSNYAALRRSDFGGSGIWASGARHIGAATSATTRTSASSAPISRSASVKTKRRGIQAGIDYLDRQFCGSVLPAAMSGPTRT